MSFRKNITAIVILFSLAGVFLFASGQKDKGPKESVDLSRVRDGIYEGEAKNWPIKVNLTMEVLGQKITHIDLVYHRSSSRGKPANSIIENIIAAQSLDVDVISGASLSSRTILEAAEDALRKGL